MNAYSKRALLSVVLGTTGILFAQTRVAGSLLAAIFLGLTALLASAKGFRLIFHHPGSFWGKTLAYMGALPGTFVAVLCVLASLGMFLEQLFRQFDPQPRWEPGPGALNPLPDQSVTNFTSNLPIIILDTREQPDSPETLTPMRAKFFEVHGGRASLEVSPDYEGPVTIRIRGHTTRHLPKRSYTFHMVDHQGNQIHVPLLGLPPGDDWVLYAPYEDKSLMRDVLAYELTRQMGHYAPRTRFVELFIQTTGPNLSLRDYAGIYVLIEKIKRGKDRVNIAKLEPQDTAEPEITGGYIVKRDHDEGAGGQFRTPYGGPFFFVYPKSGTITRQQRAWLRGYFHAFENALYGDDFQDPQRGYAAYLDVDAFIDAHWLIEMSKNIDGFRYSTYLTKDRGGKLKPGPPWDWNRSFGNANYHNGWQPQGWYWPILRSEEISWFKRLQEDARFRARCAQRWLELRRQVFDVENLHRQIDQWAILLEEAQQRNFKRWPVLGEHITCNHYVGQSYADEVRWLKQWIAQRIKWIDSQLQ